MVVRDRYAPSPTGLQHVGGIRTALFNYLFARSKGGKFILRLEDTDRARSDAGYVQNLYDTLAWLGLNWDEGPLTGGPAAPYVQSERVSIYKKYARELLDKGQAYYCFCTSERIEKLRLEREAARSPETGYDRLCRRLDPKKATKRAEEGEPCTVRLKIPLGETTRFEDRLLGAIEWKNNDVNPDPVLLKSDGFPTYHLANVVDDHLMEVTHVMRAQEWLPSTPLHVIMYKCFGWQPPEFCHLPMVMGQDGKKLSKRHGATSIDEFRAIGCLPEALINYVALLGASYGEEKDIYTPDELRARFDIDKLNKAPAVFDYKKLEWYNGQYIRMKSDRELASLCLPFAKDLFEGGEPDERQMEVFVKAMPLVKERLVYLSEVSQKLSYLFKEPLLPPKEEFIPKKSGLAQTVKLLELARDITTRMTEAADDEEAEKLIKREAERNGVKLGDLMMPLRVAVTGSRVSPPLFGSLRLLGPEVSLRRVSAALDKCAATDPVAQQRGAEYCQ
ncbi:MAG: glutamate--tRNA ligase [Treponema sp.]|jgi:glutamyl-tRNA synthetase|nr:glutamate--tRNA ligase [Treponema sp.]